MTNPLTSQQFAAVEQRSAALESELDTLLDQIIMITLDPQAPGARETLAELGAGLDRYLRQYSGQD